MSDAESRWGHLVGAAFRLDEAAPADPRAALRALDGVLEVFDAQLDPVEDYPGYAVRRLALSLHKALAQRD